MTAQGWPGIPLSADLRGETGSARVSIFSRLDEGQDWSVMAADLRAELDKLR